MNIPSHHYPQGFLPKALGQAEFYVLLALSRGPLTRYALKSVIRNDSLGAIVLRDGYTYPLISRMHDEGLVEIADVASGSKRYEISNNGLEVLAIEATRLQHALAIFQRL